MLGWATRYNEIVNDFGYSKKKDVKSSRLLDSLLSKKTRLAELKKLIENESIFIIGAGPSLLSCIPILKKYNKIGRAHV